MARPKMDWRGVGGFFKRNAAGDLVPTEADGTPIPVDEDGYLLEHHPRYSKFGPRPPLSRDVPREPASTPAPAPAKKTVTGLSGG